jgi:hypothetical protein
MIFKLIFKVMMKLNLSEREKNAIRMERNVNSYLSGGDQNIDKNLKLLFKYLDNAGRESEI